MVIKDHGNLDNEQGELNIRVLAAQISGQHAVLIQKFDTIDAKFDDMSHRLDSVVDKIDRHVDKEDKDLRAIKDTVEGSIVKVKDEVLSGFPQKDPIRHHDYHIDVMDTIDSRKKRNQEIITFVAKSAIWAILGIIAIACWNYVKVQVQMS